MSNSKSVVEKNAEEIQNLLAEAKSISNFSDKILSEEKKTKKNTSFRIVDSFILQDPKIEEKLKELRDRLGNGANRGIPYVNPSAPHIRKQALISIKGEFGSTGVLESNSMLLFEQPENTGTVEDI